MDVPNLHKEGMKKTGNFCFILISDTRSQKAKDQPPDKTTPLVTQILQKAGHKLLATEVIPDEISAIQEKIKQYISQYHPQFIITSGGTGITTRDITREAVQEILDRKIPGFGELFRVLSFQEIGAAALFSRAFAGVIGSTTVVCLPGSPNAVKMALEQLILPEVPHFHRMIPQK